ncbi:hypothetical protein [Streptomyces sp. NPDC052225]|uniref:hypothetical protein n=1 Tax=Streptomyces sp. NPDC052225 TaxID=3154949 RepID=UPI003419CCE7
MRPHPEFPGRPALFRIIDMSGVTFMDCRGRHGRVRLVRGPVSTDLVLRASGLAPRFPWYASAQDAWRNIPSCASRPERAGPYGSA